MISSVGTGVSSNTVVVGAIATACPLGFTDTVTSPLIGVAMSPIMKNLRESSVLISVLASSAVCIMLVTPDVKTAVLRVDLNLSILLLGAFELMIFHLR